MKSEKLQKVLARAGIGSRRKMEAMIAAGRVSVNGKIAETGKRVTPKDRLRVDGRDVRYPDMSETKSRILLYNKPPGEVCTRDDPEGRPTVFDKLPRIRPSRWIAIGRLDFHTSGLLLFTNDGELANKAMHPSSELEREYAVRVFGEVNNEILARLHKGVELEDGPANFEVIVDNGGEGSNHWYHVIVKQGRNRIVRRLWESQGVTVSRLIRVRYGRVIMPRYVKTGTWIELDDATVGALVADTS